jgi:hypothetical protein
MGSTGFSKANGVLWLLPRSSGMTYRRGFQRIYAVLTVAWIAGILLFLPTDRLDFWRKWDMFDQFAAHPCATPAEIFNDQQAQRKTELPPCTEQEVHQMLEQALKHAEKPTWIYEHITLAVPIESRFQRFLWLLCLLMAPPAVGYVVLFYVAPWVFRGFKISRARAQGLGVRGT